MGGPSGTVTFLFTDVVGSTHRWETDAEAMQSALASHDAVLRSAIDAHDGWMFKHTGDGVCAAFGSARSAIDAALRAQLELGLPVRMGIATGEAQQRDGDYFGPVLNRAARVMASGHGGQILVASSTAALLDGVELLDLGEHRLRDLSGSTHLFQLIARGLRLEFPPLRTVDQLLGNVPVQATSFVGRGAELTELVGLVHEHRLVTLTGVGGVGKTRLALHVAAELASEFGDGIWLAELASIGDPSAVPDVVAAALGVTPQARSTATESIALALSGRRLLLVLDNCEHVLDVAAALVETLLARTTTVKILATSREGLHARAEQLWPVPSLDHRTANSAAVALFMDRARAVNPAFALQEPEDVTAVVEICRRLDGIPLAIELAAARMVSMSPADVRDRLSERFRLLVGARRGLERHQTLRHAVGWSFDLLDDAERAVLGCCFVFADGFDVAAATYVCGEGIDEYDVLDVLDALVRKSLVIATRAGGRIRYGMLETIRQFSEERLGTTAAIDEVRDRHASYFATHAVAMWERWDSPRQRVAIDWVETESSNLRAAFHWASERGYLDTAATIATHTAMLCYLRNRFESVAWVEELLEAACTADLVQLPRLYTAAALCTFTGRPEDAIEYAQKAAVLEANQRYEAFAVGWAGRFEAIANGHAGRAERWLQIHDELIVKPGIARIHGLTGKLYALSAVGRAEDARALAEETITAARAHGNPYLIAFALEACGRAYFQTEPARALAVYGELAAFALDEGLRYEAPEAAYLEAVHGEPERGLDLFDQILDRLHRSGNVAHLARALAHLAALFHQIGEPGVAATLYGSIAQRVPIHAGVDLPSLADALHDVLGAAVFDERVAAGAALTVVEVAPYARHEIQCAQRRLADPP